MSIRSLNRLRHIRTVVLGIRRLWLIARFGIELHPSSTISTSGRIVSGRRGSIRIGRDTLVAFKTLLITRDLATGKTRPITIGSRCFIGGAAVIMPGVTIGDESIIGSGAVVYEDVPSRSIAVGNPARVIRSGIRVGKRGRLEGADDNSRRTWR